MSRRAKSRLLAGRGRALGRVMGLAMVLGGCAMGGCGPDPAPLDGGIGGPDAGVGDLGLGGDGGSPLRGAFTVIGCEKLEVTGAGIRCSGHAPLELQFVPLVTGGVSFVWSFPGGDPPSSQVIAPVVRYALAGSYQVTLAAGGSAGTTTSPGTVVVMSGEVGAPCGSDADCDPAAGLGCVCPAGAGCPGALAYGLCSRACDGALCGVGELCVDLSRGAGGGGLTDGGIGDAGTAPVDPWRRALCLPGCAGDGDCRPGLRCRQVPALFTAAPAKGPYAWQGACFAEALGAVGEACLDAAGLPDASRCLSGRCDPLGARGLCTDGCAQRSCPSGTACVSFNEDPGDPVCLRRCDPTTPCTDPLLGCELAGKAGGLGFTVAGGEPAGTLYCAPRPCMSDMDCAPAGRCASAGAASFCVRL